tara:strand:- start:173 stop:367 length:195 start_codon:yes stop_codon:yes gene_type:complete
MKTCKYCQRKAHYWYYHRGQNEISYICGNHTWWHGTESQYDERINDQTRQQYFNELKEEYKITC